MLANRHRLLLILLMLFSGWFLPGRAAAQSFTGGPGPQMESTLDKVDVEVLPQHETVTAGDENSYAIILEIEEGWHLNAHDPPFDYLIGVDLTLDAPELGTVTGVRYPTPVQLEFEFAGGMLDVYEGRSAILVDLETSSSLARGSHELTGTLLLQACSDAVCLPPAEMELSIPLVIGDETIASAHEEMFQQLEQDLEPSATVSDDNMIAALFNDHGMIWMFIGIFFIGLALNLTPCVYPMVSVTISLFGGAGSTTVAGTTGARRFTSALVYLSGIVFMYSTLGAVAAYTGGLFGSWLQSSWVTGGIGVLLLLLSLSMFGLYELQPPSWLQQKLGRTQQVAGHLGHFLSGLLVGVFAAPCIGPPIIALMAFVGAQGSPLFGFSLFFVLALGLGLPYLLLATFSGWLDRLPSSGDWMIWVKKLFGIVLVGIGLFYLSLALLPGYTMYILLIVLIAGGIYLGFLERSGEGSTLFKWVKPVVGSATLVAALLLFLNLQKQSVEWEPYDEGRLEEAVAAGEPIMLDFYADWCIPCIEMERRTFTNSDVINRTESFVRMKVDLTHFNSEASEALRRQYGVAGVPTYMFLDSEGNEVEQARVTGFMEAERFLEHVEMTEQMETALCE